MIKYETDGKKVSIEAHGNIETLLTDVSRLIAIVYRNIKSKTGRAMFREVLAYAINAEDSPIWETKEEEAAKIVSVDMEELKKQLEELKNEGR